MTLRKCQSSSRNNRGPQNLIQLCTNLHRFAFVLPFCILLAGQVCQVSTLKHSYYDCREGAEADCCTAARRYKSAQYVSVLLFCVLLARQVCQVAPLKYSCYWTAIIEGENCRGPRRSKKPRKRAANGQDKDYLTAAAMATCRQLRLM